jgi:hypothetical protein
MISVVEEQKSLIRKERSYKDLLFMMESSTMVIELDAIQRGVLVRTETGFGVQPAPLRSIIEIIHSKYGEFDMDVFMKHYNRIIRTWCNETKNEPDEYPIGIDEFIQVRLGELEAEEEAGRVGLDTLFSEMDKLASEQGIDRGTFIARNPEWREKIRNVKNGKERI